MENVMNSMRGEFTEEEAKKCFASAIEHDPCPRFMLCLLMHRGLLSMPWKSCGGIYFEEVA